LHSWKEGRGADEAAPKKFEEPWVCKLRHSEYSQQGWWRGRRGRWNGVLEKETM
jgi:hypothetical protein